MVTRRTGKYALPVRVTLSCGHVVKARMHPISMDVRMGCNQGLGCGYSLAWVSWEDTERGFTGTNTKAVEGKEEGQDG